MDLSDFFVRVEETLLSRFREAGFVEHLGDRGDNREEILRDFLRRNLPSRYGVLKGEIVTRSGKHTHSADVIIYDALNCPVLYSGKTAVVPIEGVYGIIEVKSRLSKGEFLNATEKIESFKRLAPRELSLIETREYMTVHRASRPFGIVLGFQLDGNSLSSLAANFTEQNERIHDVNYFLNFAAVLGAGVLRFDKVNLSEGTRELLLGTDEFVNLVLMQHKRTANQETRDEILVRVLPEEAKERTFGRFFVYLLIVLARMKLGTPDLGRYLDPDLPYLISRES